MDTVERLDALDPVRWWLGWHPFGSVLGGIAVGVVAGYAVVPWLVVVGSILGIAAFAVGALYVDSEASAIVAAFETEGPEIALASLDPDDAAAVTDSAVEPADSLSPPMLDERSEYAAAAVAVGDTALLVSDRVELDLVARSVTTPGEPRRYAYADVGAFRYANGTLSVDIDGETESRPLPESLREAVAEAERRRDAFASASTSAHA